MSFNQEYIYMIAIQVNECVSHHKHGWDYKKILSGARYNKILQVEIDLNVL